MRNITLATLLAFAFGSMAQAHVTVWPQESRAAAGERYVVRVPTEGKITTTSVELEVPTGVVVTGVAVPNGFTYEVKREGDRIVTITWKQDIKPGEYGEFVFFARNPKAAQVGWKVHQRYSDGTSDDWVGPAGDRRPAAVTKLTAGATKE